MNRSISTHLSALGLAALATVSLIGGIQHLATTPASPDTMAAQAAASSAQVAAADRQRPAGG